MESNASLTSLMCDSHTHSETRRDQARLFNTPGSGFNVLIATNAVGMGLNLNIRRIIFSTLMVSD